MDSLKIIIVGPECIDKKNIIDYLIQCNSDLSIIPHCTNLQEFKNNYNKYTYFLDINSLYLAYKNNSLMTIVTNNNISDAVTIDDFYNNDVVYVTCLQFNMISEAFLNSNNILIIWLDTKYTNNISESEINEIKYIQDNINKYKYLYFLDTDYIEICKVILKYIDSDDDIRNEILSNYA